MPNLVGPETVDTRSTDSLCEYPAAPIGGVAIPTTVVVNKVPLKIVAGAPVPYTCSPTVPAPLPTNIIPLPCQSGARIIRPLVNKTVFINGQLPAVTGDEAQLFVGGTPRPLTGPFQHPTILIGTTPVPTPE